MDAFPPCERRLRATFPRLVVAAIVCAIVAGVPVPGWSQDPAWTPPEPNPTAKDWIRLVSGEWLRGSINLFRDKSLEFDSEELDDLVIDFDDISEIRSPRTLTFTLESGTTYIGTAAYRDGIFRVQTDAGVQEFPGSELLTIIEGMPNELNLWSAKASIGMTARSGNTNQVDFNALIRLRREATKSRLGLEYTGNFGEVDDQQTVNNHRGNGRFDYFISRGFFITPFNGEAYYDDFQNIQSRYSISAGAGYFLIRNSTVEWALSFGGGYQQTNYVSVEAGTPDSESSGTVTPETNLEADLTSDIELTFNYSGQISVTGVNTTTHHTYALLDIDLISIFDLVMSLTWDRVDNPRENADGFTPKKDDFRTAISFGVDL